MNTPFGEVYPMFSPDGNWIAYQSNESGQAEIYVVPYPGPGGKQQVSTAGGTLPRWSRDGRELFYRIGNSVMVVSVSTEGGSFRAGNPQQLFEDPLMWTSPWPEWDVAPDGKGLVVIRQDASEGASLTQVIVVLNWFNELKRLVPME